MIGGFEVEVVTGPAEVVVTMGVRVEDAGDEETDTNELEMAAEDVVGDATMGDEEEGEGVDVITI